MQCTAKNRRREPCRNSALAGSEYCFFHDPASREQRRASQSTGGQNRALPNATPEPPPNFSLKDISGIGELTEYVMNQVVAGKLDPKVANAASYLASIALNVNAARQKEAEENSLKSQEPEQALDLTKLCELPLEEQLKLLRQVPEKEVEQTFYSYGDEELTAFLEFIPEEPLVSDLRDEISGKQIGRHRLSLARIRKLAEFRLEREKEEVAAKATKEKAAEASAGST